MNDKLQIKLEYNSIEDRLLIRIAEKSGPECAEYRLWLTRRYIGIFMKATDKLIGDVLASDMSLSPEALRAMKKFQQEAALAKADFSTSYGASCTQNDDPPLLVSTVKIKKKAKGRFVLSLLTAEKAGVHLTADIDLIHTLRKMLVDLARNAGWFEHVIHTVGQNDEATEPVLFPS